MTDLSRELAQINSYLPDEAYLSYQRFSAPFLNRNEFEAHIASIFFKSCVSVSMVIRYACKMTWSIICAASDLLILKPNAAWNECKNAGIYFTISLILAALEVANVISSTIASLTRIVASWRSEESKADLSSKNWDALFAEGRGRSPHLIPSQKNYAKMNFFVPYKNTLDFFESVISPVASGVETALACFDETLKGVKSFGKGVSQLIIGKPRHCAESMQNASVHFALSLGLAIITPITIILETILTLSRMSGTWISACGLTCSQGTDTGEFRIPPR